MTHPRPKTFLKEYVEGRTDLKPRTIAKFNATIEYLVENFGAHKALSEINEGDAEDFGIFLLGKGQFENTVRKHIQITKRFFTKAVRQKVIEVNPFRQLKSTTIANPDRYYYLNAENSKKLLKSLPGNQRKLIFAHRRWGGLRCPSEVLELRWADIDLENNRIKVTSPKKEHHGKGARIIPLFPKLKPLLDKAFFAKDGESEYVISKYRDSQQNLRTMFRRYIEKAELEIWPNVFQKLRATRETELAQRFPIHVVYRWMGYTEAVAAKHYL